MASRGFEMEDDGEGFSDNAPYVAGGVGCCLVLVLVFVLASLAAIEPTEYGVVYNLFTRQISDRETLEGGRYYIGPISSVFAFPATVRNLEFSKRSVADQRPLESRTSEGFKVVIEVAFQYKLQKDSVKALFRNYQETYEARFINYAQDVLLRTSTQFSAQDYWQRRGQIQLAMQTNLNDRLMEENVECRDLQLMIIELPAHFEDQIITTQVQRQTERTRAYEQQSSLIRAETQVLMSTFAQNKTVTLNGASANASLLVREARARARKSRLEVESHALNTSRNVLGLSTKGLVKYQRGLSYQNLDSASFIYGVKHAVAVSGSR